MLCSVRIAVIRWGNGGAGTIVGVDVDDDGLFIFQICSN